MRWIFALALLIAACQPAPATNTPDIVYWDRSPQAVVFRADVIGGLILGAGIALSGACPGTTLALSATIQGANGASATVPFNVGDAATLFTNAPGFAAFGELAGPFAANSFDWGLAFFYGRSVYTAIEGASTPGGTGPYVAF